jgi:hypothetical protein
MKRRSISVLIAPLLLMAAQAQTTAVTLPAGARLRVKLQTPVNTKTANSGDPVDAILIAPLLPASLQTEIFRWNVPQDREKGDQSDYSPRASAPRRITSNRANTRPHHREG